MRKNKTLAAFLTMCATAFAVAVAPTAAHADWQVEFMSVPRPTGSGIKMVMNVRNGSSANMTPVQLYQLQQRQLEPALELDTVGKVRWARPTGRTQRCTRLR